MLPGYVLGLGSRGLVVGLLGTGRVGIGGIVSGIFLGTGGVELPGRGWLEEALFAFVGAEPSEGESADLFCPTGDACGGDGGTSGDQSASGVGVDGEGSVLTSVSVTVPAETVPAGAPEPEAVAAAGDSGKGGGSKRSRGRSGSRKRSTIGSCCSFAWEGLSLCRELRVPRDLGVGQIPPRIRMQASVQPPGSIVPREWRVPNHDVLRVQHIPLPLDPLQTQGTLVRCCSFASVLCVGQFTNGPNPLMLQALAEVLEVRVAADLKTSQIWGDCGAMLSKPSPAALDLNSNRHG